MRAPLRGARSDHDDGVRQGRHDSVPAWEVPRPRLRAGRVLGQQSARFGDRLLQVEMLGGVGDVDAAPERRDGPALGYGQGAGVGGAVDPEGHAAGDPDTAGGEVVGNPVRHPQAVGTGVPGAHDGNAAHVGRRERSPDEEGRRGIREGEEGLVRPAGGRRGQDALTEGARLLPGGAGTRTTDGHGELRRPADGGEIPGRGRRRPTDVVPQPIEEPPDRDGSDALREGQAEPGAFFRREGHAPSTARDALAVTALLHERRAAARAATLSFRSCPRGRSGIACRRESGAS